MRTIFTLILSIIVFSASAETLLNERIGYARDINTGELIYTETHNEVFENGRIVSDTVTYKDADGQVIAEKEVDYTAAVTMPDFSLVNYVTGHKESASKQQQELEVMFARNDQDDKEIKIIPLPEQGIIDAGFDRFVSENWDELSSGQKLVRKMLIPSMKKFIDFRIYQAELNEQENKRLLKVEPNSVLFRFLAEPLKLEYAVDEPRLISFTGTGNMRDEKGENLQVNITFPPQEIRVTLK